MEPRIAGLSSTAAQCIKYWGLKHGTGSDILFEGAKEPGASSIGKEKERLS